MKKTSSFRRGRLAVRRMPPAKAQLLVEPLEDRTLPAEGLVAAYAFNEGSGATVADASGSGNVGTLSNAVSFPAGRGTE